MKTRGNSCPVRKYIPQKPNEKVKLNSLVASFVGKFKVNSLATTCQFSMQYKSHKNNTIFLRLKIATASNICRMELLFKCLRNSLRLIAITFTIFFNNFLD